jgi:SagB-type dehydrogenase family enzyme
MRFAIPTLLVLLSVGLAPAQEDDALPALRPKGEVSLEEALATRRSVRFFRSQALTRTQIGQLLWAAQGITDAKRMRMRTAPSAGALYPLDLHVATEEGLFSYVPAGHRLVRRSKKDLRDAIHAAALKQSALALAPAIFVVTAVYARTAKKYGERRSLRYVHMEAGHAAQNLLLQATALGLGAVPIGAFHDERIRQALGLPADHAPLYLIPVGVPGS